MLSSGQEFDEKFLDSKHVLKVYFKPSRKNKIFVFLPDPILPVWLRILHLIGSKNSCGAIFLITEVIKAKKTTTRPNHRKLQWGGSKAPNLML